MKWFNNNNNNNANNKIALYYCFHLNRYYLY